MTEAIGVGAAATQGLVRVHGELWRATSAMPIAAGTHVRVLRVDGLTLRVEPLEASRDHRSSGLPGDERR